MELTVTEIQLLEMIREARPYETIQISKDKGGKANSYFVIRTQKLFIDGNLQAEQ